MTTRIRDQDGNVLEIRPGTQVHPSGMSCARDAAGVPLAAAGYEAALAPAAPKPAAEPVPPPTPERLAQIRAAIAGLSRDDASCWTKAGVPKVQAIEAVLGSQITQAERDAAWAATTSNQEQ